LTLLTIKYVNPQESSGNTWSHPIIYPFLCVSKCRSACGTQVLVSLSVTTKALLWQLHLSIRRRTSTVLILSPLYLLVERNNYSTSLSRDVVIVRPF